MSLYGRPKFLFHLYRDAPTQRRYRDERAALLAEYTLSDEERAAIVRGDIGLTYVLGANGQLLMHFAAFLGMPWPDYLQAMRDGVVRQGPVRAGVYAMTTSTDNDCRYARPASRFGESNRGLGRCASAVEHGVGA